MYFSKSKYCGLWQCPKIAWLNKYKPDECEIDDGTRARMVAGNEVGDLAMGLFGEYNEVTSYRNDKLDIPKMIELTQQYMAEGRDNICEASFNHNGLYCAVDILRKQGNGGLFMKLKVQQMKKNMCILPIYHIKNMFWNTVELM